MAMPAPQPENFYVVGGTMRHDSPSYVERGADRELFHALRRAEYCHVLTARQMGKSSLMLRTAFRLRRAGVKVAVLDLTAIGQNLTAEQWYSGLVLQLGERLDLEDKLLDFWTAHTWLGPMQRWVETLRKAVLPESAGQLVIFVDEIDAVRSLNFSTDEFFAGVRECYNHRQADEEMRRLTFCLIGVATPSDLIRDTRTTPFNIGTRIELNDFTEAEALPLADGLPWGEAHNRAILKRVLYWTAGHPYLTQRICQAVAASDGMRRAADADALIEELFFSKRANEYDDNLIFVRERLLRGGADVTALLNLYAKVRRGKAVPDADADPLVPILRLSGVTRGERGLLRVRNRIYGHVFDSAWVTANLPGAEARRQREAYRRGVWRAAIISAIILTVVIGLAITALWQLKAARQEAKLRRRLLYTTQMRLINQEWENANVSRVEELLEAAKPLPSGEDLRGYEWPLFYHNSHSDLFRLPNLDRVVSVRFLKDQSLLAIGSVSYSMVDNERTYTIKLYNWKAGEEIISFQANTKARFDIVSFSPDLKYVATDDPNNQVVLWKVDSGEHIKDLGTGRDASVKAVAFSPDQRYLVSGHANGVVRLYNLATGQTEWEKQIGQSVNGLAFSPDGSLLAITTSAKTLELFDRKTRRMLPPFSVKGAALNHAFFSPDGNMLVVTAEDGSLYLWDMPHRQVPRRRLRYTTEITALAFAPDGKTFAFGSSDRTVRLRETATGNELRLIRGHGSKVNCLDWSADGQFLITGSSDGTVKVWDASARDLPLVPKQVVQKYYATAFTPGGELIALCTTDDKHTRLWNLSTGQQLADLGNQKDEILVAVFSRDGQTVAVSYGNNRVDVCEAYTGRRIRTLTGLTTAVKGLSLSPDGRLLVSGSEQAKLNLWEVAGESEPVPLNSGNGYYCTAFSPDGKSLASADGDGTIRLWDVASWQIIKTLPGHQGIIRSLAFSADGRLLASGSDDHTVRLWEVSSGNGLAHEAQADSVYRLAFSPDGKRLITGGYDGAVILWNTADMQEVLTLEGFTRQVSSLTFSGDGTTLAASSEDGTIRVWQAAPMNESAEE